MIGRVFVYWNLHAHKFSVKALSGKHRGRVVAHADDVILDGVEFRVNQRVRERILRTRRKEVHAGLVGELIGVRGTYLREMDRVRPFTYNVEGDLQKVRYNPYLMDSFQTLSGDRIDRCGAAILVATGCGPRVLVTESPVTVIYGI